MSTISSADDTSATRRATRHCATWPICCGSSCIPTDAVARYGGEEFVILLPGAGTEDALSTVSRLQRELTTHVFLHEASRTFITFSAGITEVTADDSLATAINRADEAMYRAKHEGKNCVRTA